MIKYINNKIRSSGVPTEKVNFGGIKKKSHINALKIAASNTGKMSRTIAKIETVTKRRKATTLYPIKSIRAKPIDATIQTEKTKLTDEFFNK